MQTGFLRRITVMILAIILVLSVFGVCTDKAFASSATVTLSGGGTFEKGGTVTITLKYTGATFGSATAKLTYDSDILEYSSCSGAEANGGSGTVKVTMANGSGTSSLSCKVTFKAKKVGKSTVTASTSDIYNIDLEELSAGSKSTTVTVQDSSTAASTNANLSSMKVSCGTLSPAFSKNVTSYTVNVDNSVTECLITATKEDSKSTITVSGSKDLKVGENTRKVIVTAESGNTKTYTVKIIRAAAGSSNNTDPSENTDNSDNQQTNTSESSEQAIETVIKNTTYIVVEDLEGIDIPSTFSIAEASYNDEKIPVIKSQEGNIVLGLLKAKDSEETDEGQWYFYNEKKNQFFAQHYMTVEEIFAYGNSLIDEYENQSQQTGAEGLNEADENGLDTTDFMLLIFGATLGLLLIVVICLQVGIMKEKKSK